LGSESGGLGSWVRRGGPHEKQMGIRRRVVFSCNIFNAEQREGAGEGEKERRREGEKERRREGEKERRREEIRERERREIPEGLFLMAQLRAALI
jgi:hypothetical protein